MDSKSSIVVTAQMLIRKPINEVFEAFVNPDITCKFWFSKSSGRLDLGAKVRLDWEMFDVSDALTVKEFELNRRLLIEWENDPTSLEWHFAPREDGTLVTISNWGFSGGAEKAVSHIVDAKGGYTMVLAGAKAWLEHGIELNLVRDQFPEGCPQ